MLLKKELKLEVGKKYLNGRGEVFGPMEMNNGSLHEKFPFKAKGAPLEAFRENGTYSLNPFKESHLDLISEYTDGAANGYTEEKNTVEVSKEFVLKAYIEACVGWRRRIEKELPELFKKPELEVGKWYKDSKNMKFIGRIKSVEGDRFFYYGFSVAGHWRGNDWYCTSELAPVPATDEEVLEALCKEAKRRGYVNGARVNSLVSGYENLTINYATYKGSGTLSRDKSFALYIGYLWVGCRDYNAMIFDGGKWADILPEESKQTELTLSEIADKFGIPVSQLRVKE